MKIYAPVKDANGVWASVRFVNGVGETDDPRLIEWFRSHGYEISDEVQFSHTVENDEIEHDDDEVELMGYAEKEPKEPKEPCFEDMTSNELRQWMMENGFGSKIRNTRNKEKLLEILRG